MAEAAGLALAILPLLISAIEHYDDSLKPFRRFCHFSSQVNKFLRRVEAQQAIFLNQCRLLLEESVESDTASQMIKDRQHPFWADTEVDGELQRQLDASLGSCTATVHDINTALKRLREQSAKLNSAVEQETKDCTFGSKAWRTKTKTKVKFSFSKSCLEESLIELKDLNATFLTLSSQTSKLRKQQLKDKTLVKPLAQDIEKVNSIQQASCKVYEALCHSCSKHSEHRTHFCLETKAETKTSSSRESLHIQFKVAFGKISAQEQDTTCGPTFFIIESVLVTSHQDQQSPMAVINTLKRTLSGDYGTNVKKIKKSVRFLGDNCAEQCHPSLSELRNLKNLGLHQNFCDRIRECFQRSSAEGIQYMGLLGNSDTYRHLVYVPEKKARRPALSLQEILSISSRRDPSLRLTMLERIHLARSLATAVLQYHATPWLTNPWRSEDILFFGAEERLLLERSLAPISEPHIDVPVKKSISGSIASFHTSGQHLASNILLFNLGVMLIELAYMATLKTLLNRKERSQGDTKYIEFFAARRLSEVVGREMGTKYARIVRKCVECHFASGSDLNNSELQGEYYRDVVKELEGLEDSLASLNIGK